MKKKTALLLMWCMLVFTGCGKSIEPFKESPENSIKIEEVDKSIAQAEEIGDVYKWYYMNKVEKKNGDELAAAGDKYKSEHSKEEYDKYLDNLLINGEKLRLLHVCYDKKMDSINTPIRNGIRNYLIATRMNKGQLDDTISQDLKNENPIEKSKEYLEKNKIQVKEFVFADTFEDINQWTYPMKYTYKYTIKGTQNGKSFEKEVKQDFYIGFDMKSLGDNRYSTQYEIVSIKDHK